MLADNILRYLASVHIGNGAHEYISEGVACIGQIVLYIEVVTMRRGAEEIHSLVVGNNHASYFPSFILGRREGVEGV
jgi:hypothetical protein